MDNGEEKLGELNTISQNFPTLYFLHKITTCKGSYHTHTTTQVVHLTTILI